MLECCGETMVYLKPQNGDPASEKHIPFVMDSEDGVLVKIGKHFHPMVKAHYIYFTEMESDNFCVRKFFSPGEDPGVFFYTKGLSTLSFRSYCLIHGVFQIQQIKL